MLLFQPMPLLEIREYLVAFRLFMLRYTQMFQVNVVTTIFNSNSSPFSVIFRHCITHIIDHFMKHTYQIVNVLRY